MKMNKVDPVWMQVTEQTWNIWWLIVRVFLICAAIPSGVLFGLRVAKLICKSGGAP